MRTKRLAVLAFGLLLLSRAGTVWADTLVTSTSSTGAGAQASAGAIRLSNPLGAESLPALVGNVLRIAIGIVGAVSLLIFISGGLRWLTSGGEAAKIQAGKDAMKWAAIGLVVIFSSYALVGFVFKLFTG